MTCIIYQGNINTTGYGRLPSPRFGTRGAHRALLAEHLGRRLSRHEFACHTCNVRACVNIDHIYLGDAASNMRDTLRSGNASGGGAKLTHCKRGHEFTEYNTYRWRGRRICRRCNNARNKEYKNATN